jgi:hypothetical protein
MDGSSLSNCAKEAHFAFSGFQFLIVLEFPLSIGTIIYSHRRSRGTSEKRKKKIEIERSDRVRWDTRLLRRDPATIVDSIPNSTTVISALFTEVGHRHPQMGLIGRPRNAPNLIQIPTKTTHNAEGT